MKKINRVMKKEITRQIKLCKVKLTYSVEYYVAANDNKEETAIAIADKNVSSKLKQIIGDTFQFDNAEIIDKKEREFTYVIDVDK